MIAGLLRLVVRTILAVASAGVILAILRAPRAAARAAVTRASTDSKAAWRWIIAAGGLLTLAAAGGGLVLVSGIVPIKASSGHWAITEAFLQFAKRRSVSTYALGVDVPPLDEHRLVVQGAAHYDFGCRPCHGSPALPQPRIAARMTPRPPDLRDISRRYDPEELFSIVKHGIKMTGMPAWPALQRDDEVWAVVAFLRALPALDAQRYQALATGANATPNSGAALEDLLGPGQVPDAVRENCSRCHGLDGLARGGGAFPRLAGQRPAYLAASLRAYAQGQRHSGIMEPLAAVLDEVEVRAIAEYYGGLPDGPPAASATNPGSRLHEGAEIARRGLPDRLVPPCASCHGPGTRRRNPHYPELDGQFAEYIYTQLSLFKSGRRGGTAYRGLMRRVAGQLSDDQMRAVAAYYASLAGEP